MSSTSNAQGLATFSQTEKKSETRMKILLADDLPELLAIMTKQLENLGHEVVNAKNGEEAFKLAQTHSDFDLICSDIKMPVLNGLELLEKLRLAENDTPVVLVTGAADLKTSIQALKLGALDFIVKPIQDKAFQESLERIEMALTIERESIDAASMVTRQAITLVTESRLSNISKIVGYFNRQLHNICAISDLDSKKIAICLQECLTNAIIHGNFDITSAVKEQDWNIYDKLIREAEKQEQQYMKQVKIQFEMLENTIQFEISDEGMGFDPHDLPDPADPLNWVKLSGRGIIFVRSFMDTVAWNEIGNSIRIAKQFRISERPNIKPLNRPIPMSPPIKSRA